jgi:transcription antitermination factor NusG
MSDSHPAPETATEKPSIEGSWIVLWTAARAEKKVESRLSAKGIEPWLPKFTDRRRWSDRWRDVVLPLFPGYLFARVGTASISALLRIPGVMTVVKHGEQPARLSDDFVEGLRQAIERSGVEVAPVSEPIAFNVADEVIVSDGPLAGARGFVREIRSTRHLVIWVNEIGRGVAVTIGTASVRPAQA